MATKYGFETTPERSALMSKIRSTDTIPERAFRKALWAAGIRYRKTNKTIVGNPDIIIRKYKIVIFIDGEFWHGYKWAQKRDRIKNNREYWIKKIEGNMTRDKRVSKELKKQGWKIFRFWEQDVKTNLSGCISKIKKAISICM